MNWEDLRFFLSICRAGTLSGAARSLGVDQATVSRRLASLEHDLGTRLITRLPREARVTRAGAEILAQAEAMEEQSLAVRRISLNFSSIEREKVVISAPPILARHFLAPHLKTLTDRLAGIQLSVLSQAHFASLSRVEADLSIRLSPGTQDTDIIKRVGRMPFGLYATPTYEHFDDSERWAFIAYPEAPSDFDHKRWLYQVIGQRKIACEVSDLSNQFEAACTGIGVAGLPCFLGDSDSRLTRLTAQEPMLELGMWLAIHPDRRRDDLVRRTLSAITDLIVETGLGCQQIG